MTKRYADLANRLRTKWPKYLGIDDTTTILTALDLAASDELTALRALSDRDAELARVREALRQAIGGLRCAKSIMAGAGITLGAHVMVVDQALAAAERVYDDEGTRALTPQPAPSSGETYAGRTAREFKEGQQ